MTARPTAAASMPAVASKEDLRPWSTASAGAAGAALCSKTRPKAAGTACLILRTETHAESSGGVADDSCTNPDALM